MKTKLFTIVSLLAVAASAQAAELSINDITVASGTPTVDVPILISTETNEMIGAANISFAAGDLADAIPILKTDTEFDGSIWDAGGNFFGVAGTPSVHSALAAVTMISPSEVPANGTVITYTLDTADLPIGDYVLNPDFRVGNFGSSANDGDFPPNPLTLTSTPGTLTIVPEPSAVVGMVVFGVMALGIRIKGRRRG